jgi:galactonate dehydratase
MEIVDYDIYRLPPRWLCTRIETDTGIVGWGEHVTGAGGPRTVESAVRTLLDTYLVGEDPTDISDHWETMYRGGFYRGGPVLMSAIAGIDIALWDVKGKAAEAPIHELLGGRVRDRVRVYQWIGGDDPHDVASEAEQRLSDGFTAFKMNATGALRLLDSPAAVTAAADRLAAVREAVGDSVDVGVDFHGRVAKPMAKRLAAALEPHDPFFIEEPVLPEHDEVLPRLAARTTIPIATGERYYTRHDFKDLLAEGAIDVAQPDLASAGGITEVKRIADMAAAYDVALAPHCPLGPVALAASLQIDATCHNALIQEQSLNIHYNETADLLEYLADPSVFEYRDGHVPVPTDPGLGIELDRDAVESAAIERDDWTPNIGLYEDVWRHDDGSVAEW